MMGTNNVANVVAELVEEYYKALLTSGQECRLLVPGLTKSTARQLHERLLAEGDVPSYLVVDSSEEPSERMKVLYADGLTSKREGSMVIIAFPGEEAYIQDSIRGAGGTIRSVAYSDEWPWIDDGNEFFRFDGPFLDQLLATWASDTADMRWLKKFIAAGLVPATSDGHKRASTLLEGILGDFKPGDYADIQGTRERFLFHCGVPYSPLVAEDAKYFVHDVAALCGKVRDAVKQAGKREEMLRAVEDRPMEDARKKALRECLDIFFDGFGERGDFAGILGLSSSLGKRTGLRVWQTLDSETLRDLFDIARDEDASIDCKLCYERGVGSGNVLATFHGEVLTIEVTYHIGRGQGNARVRVVHRRAVLVEVPCDGFAGVATLTLDTRQHFENHGKKILLKVQLCIGDGVEQQWRAQLHLCGDRRPGFMVLSSGFQVVDPVSPVSEMGDEEADARHAAERLEIKEPTLVYLFSKETDAELRLDIDEDPLELIVHQEGIWRGDGVLDPSAEPLLVSATLPTGSILRELVAVDAYKGEFSLEDELRVQLSKAAKSRLERLVDIFEGVTRDPYPALGNLEKARPRVFFARIMESGNDGWKPILSNLFGLPPASASTQVIGGFVRCVGDLDTSAFESLHMREGAQTLIEKYESSRRAVIDAVVSHLIGDRNRIDRPLYAAFPLYVRSSRDEMETRLRVYLDAYNDIVSALRDGIEELSWGEAFVLTHLDSVVHWGEGDFRGLFSTMGPWHPLVLAKRFMVQAVLVDAARKFTQDRCRYGFNRLVVLLEQLDSFRWHFALDMQGNFPSQAYVSATSDPGWLLSIRVAADAIRSGTLLGILSALRNGLGLESRFLTGSNDGLTRSYLGNFLHAHPTRRSLGIRIASGYPPKRIIDAAADFMFEEDRPTEIGRQLPGGIHLFFQDSLDNVDSTPWRTPPVCAYEYDKDEKCFDAQHVDMHMLRPMQKIGFSEDRASVPLPRGHGYMAAIFAPLLSISEGSASVPASVLHEADVSAGGGEEQGDSIGKSFVRVLHHIRTLFPAPLKAIASVELPVRLRCPWLILPGRDIDPAIFTRYVRDGYERGDIQERALWDYHIDVYGQLNTYFILSTIPRSFLASISGSKVLGGRSLAKDIMRELGEMGIAIGGEVMRSGQHALGALGLVAAIRLFQGTGSGMPAPLRLDENHVGFLVPVDSFESLFGGKAPGEDGEEKKLRGDLLVVQLQLPHSDGPLGISLCTVECKYVSRTFPASSVDRAFEQALNTFERITSLAEAGREEDGILERLGFLNIVSFGMRILSGAGKIGIIMEGKIMTALLRGNYELVEPLKRAILVTTECELDLASGFDAGGQTLWVRVCPGNWPGVSEGAELNQIRAKLATVFEPLLQRRAEVQGPVEGATTVVTAPEGLGGRSSQATQLESVPEVPGTGSDSGGGQAETTPSERELRVPPIPRQFVGWSEPTHRWGIIGKLGGGTEPVALDLDHPKAIGIFGYMGSGKSYLLGTLVEAALGHISGINCLPSPLAVVIFNYRRQPRDRFELSSLAFPNRDDRDVLKLNTEYTALPQAMADLRILCLPGELDETRRGEYSGIPSSELFFDPSTLTVEDWEFLMGEPGSDAVFARTIRNALQELRTRGDVSLERLEQYVRGRLSGQSRSAAQLRFDFVRRYISRERGTRFGELLRPGRAVIIDLRQPLFSKEDALRFFMICANHVSQVQGQFNKMVVFDEAHEYLSNDFGERMEARIRQMRHEGTTYVFATQDVGSIPLSVRRFIATRFVFDLGTRENVDDLIRFAPEFRDHLTGRMSPGTCLVQSITSVNNAFATPRKVSVRPRVTQHGGASRVFPE